MAHIQLIADTLPRILPVSAVIGRHPQAHIRVNSRQSISRYHCMIAWMGHNWELRPLSPGGCYVNGQRLAQLQDCILKVGDEIGLGQEIPDFIITSIDPPTLFALNPLTGEERQESPEGLILSDGIMRMDMEQGREGMWVLETANGSELLNTQKTGGEERGSISLQVGDWKVYLPEQDVRTVYDPILLKDINLYLEYSSNLEHVQASVYVREEQQWTLGIHSEFWPLLLLLRARLKDPDGWIELEELQRQSGLNRKSLDVYLGRVRRHLNVIGIQDSSGIIEVRRGARRIGLLSSQLKEQSF